MTEIVTLKMLCNVADGSTGLSRQGGTLGVGGGDDVRQDDLDSLNEVLWESDVFLAGVEDVGDLLEEVLAFFPGILSLGTSELEVQVTKDVGVRFAKHLGSGSDKGQVDGLSCGSNRGVKFLDERCLD